MSLFYGQTAQIPVSSLLPSPDRWDYNTTDSLRPHPPTQASYCVGEKDRKHINIICELSLNAGHIGQDTMVHCNVTHLIKASLTSLMNSWFRQEEPHNMECSNRAPIRGDIWGHVTKAAHAVDMAWIFPFEHLQWINKQITEVWEWIICHKQLYSAK